MSRFVASSSLVVWRSLWIALGIFSAVVTRAQTVYNWDGGDIVTSIGVTTINASDTLHINTVADHDFNGRTVTNNGNVQWHQGNLRSGSGGTITNNANWTDSSPSSQINNAYGGAGGTTFINAVGGTYHKTSGVTDFYVPLVNNGTIDASGGTLSLQTGGTFNAGSVSGSSGSGVLQLVGGTLTMNGNVTLVNFLFNGGMLAGNQNFTGSTVTWQTGNWNSTNTTTLASGSTLTISTAADHDFSSHAFVNNGTVNWTAGNLRSGYGGSITNNAAWNDASDTYAISNAYGGAGGTTFINGAAGTYHKTAGVTTLSVPFVNYGAVVVTGGTLNLAVGGTFYDGSSIGSSGSGLVQFTGGTLTGGGTGSFTASNFILSGGTLAGDMVFLGTTSWISSNFNSAGTATIGAGGTFSITANVLHDFSSHVFINNGTVAWSDGDIRSGYGGVFTNNATWNDTSNGHQINNAYGGSGGTTFYNAPGALYHKISGNSTLADNVLVNDGTISVTGGILSLIGGTFNSGSTVASSGSGVVQLVGGTLTINGTLYPQNFLINGGRIAGTHLLDGTVTWNTGDFNTSGTTTIDPPGTLTIDTGNLHDFSGRTIINGGIVRWLAGDLRSGYGGSITNHGTWYDSSPNNQINNAYGGAGGTIFNNASDGIYHKTAGNTTLADSVLINNGIIDVSGGTLTLNGGQFNNGSSIGSSGSGLAQITSGILTAIGTINVQNFMLNGGRLAGDQTFLGSLTWNTGDWNTSNTTTVGNSGALTIATGNLHDFSGHAIINNGTVGWSGGDLRSGYGGTITNNGVWNDSTAGAAINNAYGGAGGTSLVNGSAGVYNKISGSTSIQVPFTNQGLLVLSGGNVSLTSTFSSSGSVTVGNGTTLSSSGALTFASSSSLNGAGTLSAPSVSVAGSIFPGTTGAGQLNITGNLSLLGSSISRFQLGGTTPATQYDVLAVSGSAALGGSLVIDFIGGFNLSVTNSMTFGILSSASLSGAFANVANGSRLPTSDGFSSFVVNYGAGSPYGVNNVVLSNFIPIPEPSTWLLLLTGSSVMAMTLRFRPRGRKRGTMVTESDENN